MDGHGQPALLYIVPCTLGKARNLSFFSSICSCPQFEHFSQSFLYKTFCVFSLGLAVALGLVRGELKELWNYGADESESHTPDEAVPEA